MDKRIPCSRWDNNFHSASTWYDEVLTFRKWAGSTHEVKSWVMLWGQRQQSSEGCSERENWSKGLNTEPAECVGVGGGGGCNTSSMLFLARLICDSQWALTKPASKLSFLDFIFIQCHHRLESIFWSYFNDRIYVKKTFLFVGRSHI